MNITPLTMPLVNWREWMTVAQREQGINVTEHLDRAGTPLGLPSSFVSAIGNLRSDQDTPAYTERYLHHLHFSFYYSLDADFAYSLATLTGLKISDFGGHGVVSGTFLEWKEAIGSLLANNSKLAFFFFHWFERARLDRYFSKEMKDDLRKKNQATGR